MKSVPKDESGQMVVELAVLAPVMLALLVVVVDLMVFLGDCARFDRVSAQAVLVAAAAPDGGSYSPAGAAGAVKAQIDGGMGDPQRLTCTVSISRGASSGVAVRGVPIASFSPTLFTCTCRMESRPWPLSHGLFGVQVAPIVHTRSYAIDPYQPGVVV